jgi:DNA-binding response OmpR family regulator
VARILVVDDNDDIRQLVSSILSDDGHSVRLAADGESALEAIRSDPPDVVILDIMMPEMDGYTVLKTMTEEGLKRRTKVIMLTAKTNEADWLQGYRLGADDYMTKPFTMEELAGTVTEVLRMSPEQLAKRRAEELEKTRLLSRIESLFDF